jgi:cytochrome b561
MSSMCIGIGNRFMAAHAFVGSCIFNTTWIRYCLGMKTPGEKKDDRHDHSQQKYFPDVHGSKSLVVMTNYFSGYLSITMFLDTPLTSIILTAETLSPTLRKFDDWDKKDDP